MRFDVFLVLYATMSFVWMIPMLVMRPDDSRRDVWIKLTTPVRGWSWIWTWPVPAPVPKVSIRRWASFAWNHPYKGRR